jgi:hypothetical protein
MRRGFVYPVTSTAKTGAFVQRLIRMRSRITVTCSEGWCVMCGVAIFLMTLSSRNVLSSDSLPLHWALKWGWIWPRLLPRDRCYCTHRSCSHDATARCVGNRIISNEVCPPRSPSLTPSDYYSWEAVKGAVCQDKSLPSPGTEGRYRRFPQEHPSDRIVTCLCKQDKKCRCVSTSTWEKFPTFVVT